jgi:acetyl esterase
LRVRHYAPFETDARPLLVFFHGGGFVVGDLDTHDTPCRALCRDARLHVLSVDYRLAPEHKFPAAVHDAQAAFRWAREHAHELGADPARVAVGGDSAGGNLAAVVSLLAARTGDAQPVLQLLLYPTTDRTRDWPSVNMFGHGFFLTREDIDWFYAHYTDGTGVDRADPAISPLCAAPLPRTAPAIVVTAAFDPLRDEGLAYARALREAGTPTVELSGDGLVHGFVSMTVLSRSSHSVMRDITSTLRGMLEALR